MAGDAVIVGAVRTVIGKRNGSLAQEHAVDLTGGCSASSASAPGSTRRSLTT